jgi:hypothetical protein
MEQLKWPKVFGVLTFKCWKWLGIDECAEVHRFGLAWSQLNLGKSRFSLT